MRKLNQRIPTSASTRTFSTQRTLGMPLTSRPAQRDYGDNLQRIRSTISKKLFDKFFFKRQEQKQKPFDPHIELQFKQKLKEQDIRKDSTAKLVRAKTLERLRDPTRFMLGVNQLISYSNKHKQNYFTKKRRRGEVFMMSESSRAKRVKEDCTREVVTDRVLQLYQKDGLSIQSFKKLIV